MLLDGALGNGIRLLAARATPTEVEDAMNGMPRSRVTLVLVVLVVLVIVIWLFTR